VSDFLRRAAFAVVAIPVAGALIWLGGFPFVVVLAMIAGLAAWEFYRLASINGIRPFDRAGIALAVIIPIVVHTNYIGATAVPPIGAGALVILAVFAGAVFTRVGERPLSVVSATLFGVLYTGGMLSFIHAIRYYEFVIDPTAGTALVLLPLVIVWSTDTGGFVFGRAFGKRKLLAAVSPGKTVVGAFGGLILAGVATALYVNFVLKPKAHLTMSPAGLVLFAVVVSASAQIGDLAESLLKREAGVKDSSRLIPGHGGVLDRADSMMFAVPVAFVLMREVLRTVP
jgi:phosphatidate cytidylyltransferase